MATQPAAPVTAKEAMIADLGAQPKPDFILDMQPWEITQDTKPRGRWCIRKFEEAQNEFRLTKKDPNAVIQYGIISYAWGIYHNKATMDFGPVMGDTNLPGLSGSPGKPAPDPPSNSARLYSFPTFDIGNSTIASETGPDIKGTNSKTFAVQSRDSSGQPTGQKREVTIGTPLTWLFPVLRSKQDKSNETSAPFTSAPFTIEQIYKALKAMKTRFVWWDWACFPQGWDKDFWTDLPCRENYQVHAELIPQQARAFNNLRYFYPASTTGCLWWHQEVWDPSIQPTYHQVDPLKIAPIPKDLIKVQDGPGNRDYNAVQRIVNNILDMVVRDQTFKDVTESAKPDLSKLDQITPVNLITNAKQGSVFQLINNLVAARAYEASLRSLWSFQEGVLFTSSRRPLRSLEQARADNATQNPSMVLDRNGNDLKMWNTFYFSDKSFLESTQRAISNIFPYGNVNLVDITFLTTHIAYFLADGLISRAYAPDEWRCWQGKTPPALPDYNTGFAAWCADKTNDGAARLLLSKLLNTGLVGYEYDSPLTLLEAKFGRNWEAYQSDMDVFINTIMGSLEIDFQAQLNIAKAASDAVYKAYGKDASRAASQVELDLAKPNFLKAVVDLYQWRFLFFARGDDFKSPAEAGFTVPFWDTLIGKERPAFAPLHVYLPGRDKEFAEVYGPNRLVEKDPVPNSVPKYHTPIPPKYGILNLPNLSVPNLKTPAIRIEAGKQDFTIYEFPSNSQAPGWTDAFCYQYVKPGALMFEVTPGATVETLALPFKDRFKLVPSTGDIALIPIKKGAFVAGITKKGEVPSSVWPPTTPGWLRGANPPAQPSQEWTTCVILVKYRKADLQTNPQPINPVPTTAVFWGMGDFKGLEASKGDVKLTQDINMY